MKTRSIASIAIDEPTMSMLFAINDSPFYGKDGKFVTSRHIHDRLTKELDKNLALRVRKSEEDGKGCIRPWCASPFCLDRNHASRRLRVTGRTAASNL